MASNVRLFVSSTQTWPPPKYFPKILYRIYEECLDEKLPNKVPKIFYTVNMRGVSTFVDAVDVWNARRIYVGMWP